MMNKVLFMRETKAGLPLLVLFAGVLTLYSSVIIVMFDPEMGESLEQMAQSMPGAFAAFGMLNASSTLTQFLSNYLYGFLLVIFPLVMILLLCNRMVVRPIDNGSMACLLATPNSRGRIIRTLAGNLIAFVTVLVAYVTFWCSLLSLILFPGSLEIGRFLLLNAGLLGLLLLFAGIGFWASCAFTDTRLAIGVGAGLPILFVLLQMAAQAGDQFSFLQYSTPLTLFDPAALVQGDSGSIGLFCILYAGAVLLFGAGIVIFRHRDYAL